MSGRWVDDHAGRFVDDGEVGVLPQNLEGEVFRNERCGGRRREFDVDSLARPDSVRRFSYFVRIKTNMTFLDQPRKGVARMFGEERGKCAIEAFAIVIGGNDGGTAIAHTVRVSSNFSFVCLKLG
jgi:hypothetical protein